MVQPNTYHTMNSTVSTCPPPTCVDIQSLVSLKPINSYIHHLLSTYRVSVPGAGEIVPSQTKHSSCPRGAYGGVFQLSIAV